MLTARNPFGLRQTIPVAPRLLALTYRHWHMAALGALVLLLGGCGQSAKPVVSENTDKVDRYFGSPFAVTGSSLARSSSAFDHVSNQIGVSSFFVQSTLVPTTFMNGTFSAADSGFLGVTENFATTSGGILSAQNPPLTGAWAIEIPGAGALANFLNVNSNTMPPTIKAGPVAMAENTACPQFATAAPFLYVTVPNAGLANDTADYGTLNISTQGSAVTLNATPSLVGSIPQTATTVTGGCSNTNLGPLTAYPLNAFQTAPNLELISIGGSGLLVSTYITGASGTSVGAFGGGTGVLGVAQSSGAIDVGAVIGAKYNGFLFAPLNKVAETYDITVLASSYGDYSASAPACSGLQASIAANYGQGAGTVSALPSANSLYGGEFLTTAGSTTVNDPTGAGGSENCDVVIDLGSQDPNFNGLFPNATVFVGSNFPPYSSATPWNCADTGTVCAVSFPAAAVVGSVNGHYVIFVAASASSTPAARLPDSSGGRPAQPVGIYLFQK